MWANINHLENMRSSRDKSEDGLKSDIFPSDRMNTDSFEKVLEDRKGSASKTILAAIIQYLSM